MKKNVLVALAISALVSSSSLCPFASKTAAADEELRYYYPDFSTCSMTTEEIYCTDMTEDVVTTSYSAPLYYATGDLTNCCGAVAGACVVGFYDRYYTDLIPNWTPYYPNNMYKRADGTYVPAVMQELYTLMRTNVDDVGVSQADCKSGLQTYFSNRNYTLSYTSIETNSVFNFVLYQQSIAANKPVILFCNNVTMCSIGYSSTSNIGLVSSMPISGGHIVIGYGYTTVKYYNGDNIFRSDIYLKVSNGRSDLADGYIKIDTNTWLVDGYSVTVS